MMMTSSNSLRQVSISLTTKSSATSATTTKTKNTTTVSTTSTIFTTTFMVTTITSVKPCYKCIGCPNGDQIVRPLNITLFCQDNKAYVRVKKLTNYSKIYEGRSYEKAGLTHFTAYRIKFENSNLFIATDDFEFSESKSIKLANGKTVFNKIKAGYGGDCNLKPRKGSFSVDLTGTKLALHQSVEWETLGWEPEMVSHLTLTFYSFLAQLYPKKSKSISYMWWLLWILFVKK